MNILNNAVSKINGLVKNQKISLKTYSIENEFGMTSKKIEKEVELYCHIQPITPAEIKKYTDATIDSNKLYKFFFSDDNAKIIYSFDVNLNSSVIIWDNFNYRIYAIRDWYIQNGWVAVYGAKETQI